MLGERSLDKQAEALVQWNSSLHALMAELGWLHPECQALWVA